MPKYNCPNGLFAMAGEYISGEPNSYCCKGHKNPKRSNGTFSESIDGVCLHCDHYRGNLEFRLRETGKTQTQKAI